MDEDIFESIADLEKRSDEVIERARLQAVELRAEVERKLQALGDELEHDYNLPREQIERELEKRRQQIFRDFEARTRASLTRLSADKREKIAPIIERVINTDFTDYTDDDGRLERRERPLSLFSVNPWESVKSVATVPLFFLAPCARRCLTADG
jgi:hypothetical protein